MIHSSKIQSEIHGNAYNTAKSQQNFISPIARLLCALLFALSCAKEARAEYAPAGLFMIFSGDILQIVSFHIGTTSDVGTNFSNGNTTDMNIGVSAGLNYLPLFESDINGILPMVGLRLRYLYSKSAIWTHSIGIVSYLHFLTKGMMRKVYPMIYPPALVLGGGFITEAGRASVSQTSGSYFECGVALGKMIPINVEILYRATFLNNGSAIGADNVVHSINMVWSIL